MNTNSRMDLAIASGYGECSVCFEPLCSHGASVMTDGRGQPGNLFRAESFAKRICRHFVCQQCAPTIIPKKCPVCRREFVATAAVPDPLADPSRWFHMVDRDQNGMIDKSELIDALKGMFPVEPGALEDVIEASWASWDRDGNGSIDADEFRNHLAPFLANTLGNLRRRMTEQLPDLINQPGEWFQHWDEDCSGSLERPEIVRALIKSIPDLTGRDEDWLTGTFSAIWTLIDPNNDGSITQAEFIMPEGLYETLVANYFGNRFNSGY